jgi:chorismate dehydratase
VSRAATLRVGNIPYLNALPFRSVPAGRGRRETAAAPRRLGELAAADALDAALLASRDALALAPEFRPLADLGIASSGPVWSVLLLSSLPIAALGGARVALSGESRTSRALLRMLLRGPLDVGDVCFVEEGGHADARLLIGDRALAARARARGSAAPYLLDLGEAWLRWTGLPFVWARWVVRRRAPAQDARALASDLRASLARPPRLAPDALPDGVDARTARAYLARFAYRLGSAEEAGLERFAKELADHDLLDPPSGSGRTGTAA